jgi:[phosphatase 2A protein]-leucine-carboxy methyltransferase
MLDEVEELELVLSHYAVTWGVKLPDTTHAASELSNRLGWEYWGLYPSNSEDYVEQE